MEFKGLCEIAQRIEAIDFWLFAKELLWFDTDKD